MNKVLRPDLTEYRVFGEVESGQCIQDVSDRSNQVVDRKGNEGILPGCRSKAEAKTIRNVEVLD